MDDKLLGHLKISPFYEGIYKHKIPFIKPVLKPSQNNRLGYFCDSPSYTAKKHIFPLRSAEDQLEWGGSSEKRNQQLLLENFDDKGRYIPNLGRESTTRGSVVRSSQHTPNNTESQILGLLTKGVNREQLDEVLKAFRKKSSRQDNFSRGGQAQKIIIKKRPEREEMQPTNNRFQTIKYIGVHNDQIGILSRRVSMETSGQRRRDIAKMYHTQIYLQQQQLKKKSCFGGFPIGFYSFSNNYYLQLSKQEPPRVSLQREKNQATFTQILEPLQLEEPQAPDPIKYDQFVVNRYLIPRRLQVSKKIQKVSQTPTQL